MKWKFGRRGIAGTCDSISIPVTFASGNARACSLAHQPVPHPTSKIAFIAGYFERSHDNLFQEQPVMHNAENLACYIS